MQEILLLLLGTLALAASEFCTYDNIVLLQLETEFITGSENAHHLQPNDDHVRGPSSCGVSCRGKQLANGGFAFELSGIVDSEAELEMSTSGALLLVILAMLFWGTWPNLLYVAKSRFELFLPDYLLGNLVVVFLLALFLEQPDVAPLLSSGVPLVEFAVSLFAGMMYASGVIAILYAIQLAGLVIVLPLSMGMELTLGVVLLLFVEGFGHVAHWVLTLAGGATACCAVVLDAVIHGRLKAEEELAEDDPSESKSSDVVKYRSSGNLGLILAAVGGLLLSVWPCLLAFVEGKGIDLFHFPGQVDMSFSTFYVLFIGGALVFSAFALPLLSSYPIGPAQPMPFFENYFKQTISTHALGLLGGFLQGLGTILSLQAGMVIGNAISVSITRCAPVVAALWGCCYWGELCGASSETLRMYAVMISLYLVAVAFLSLGSSFM